MVMVLYVGVETTIRRGGVDDIVFGVAQFECCIVVSSEGGGDVCILGDGPSTLGRGASDVGGI